MRNNHDDKPVLRNIACKNYYKCEQKISKTYSDFTKGYCPMCAITNMSEGLSLDQRDEVKTKLRQKSSSNALY